MKLKTGDVILFHVIDGFTCGPYFGQVIEQDNPRIPTQWFNLHNDSVPIYWSDHDITMEDIELPDSYKYVGNVNDSHFEQAKLSFALRYGIAVQGITFPEPEL